MKQIKSLNELKAISALMVVLSHIGCTNALLGGNPGGFAVCIFFLISGFLTVYSTENKSGGFFFLKRYLKIAPLYYVVTLFCFTVAYLKPSFFHTAEPTVLNLLKSLIFIPYINGNGISRPLLDVGWYINVLMFYYVVFRVSMLISHKYRGEISIAILLILTGIGQLFFSDNAIFLLYRNGMVTLSTGMIISIVIIRKDLFSRDHFKRKKCSYNIFLYLIYIGLAMLFSYLKINAYIKLFLPVLLFLAVLIFEDSIVPTKFTNFISKISLSIYLTHEFVVKGVSRIVYNLDRISVTSLLISIVCVAVVIIIATPVNYIFENKMSSILANIIRGKND
ncbi:acyltransferase [uncultured Ruminococcus sp.]|uniref:acyltransferase family protein n=1 Tax=uncultured Ruminococcus sp. TaxID=165186 RepID=UPI00258E81F6|nr:acyltransferase [uncultured Ruminococcus sp.]